MNCGQISTSIERKGCGCDRMVVEFTTTYALSAYHLLSCEVESSSWRGVLNTTLCDKVFQWLSVALWTPVSSTNKIDHHDITEILLKVSLNTISLTLVVITFSFYFYRCPIYCMLVTGEHFIATGDDDGIIKVMLIYYNNLLSNTVLQMKIWIYWSESNSWIYFYIHLVLNKNWKNLLVQTKFFWSWAGGQVLIVRTAYKVMEV